MKRRIGQLVPVISKVTSTEHAEEEWDGLFNKTNIITSSLPVYLTNSKVIFLETADF